MKNKIILNNSNMNIVYFFLPYLLKKKNSKHFHIFNHLFKIAKK